MKKHISSMRINQVIIYLTLSDIFTWGLYLVLNTIVGIYLAGKLGEDALKIIGIGTATYYITKAGLQIPIGLVADYIKTDRDDIIFLFTGNFLMGLPFLFYPSINSQYFYYSLQIVLGLGAALNLVNWRKLFASSLDKGKEGFEYAVYDTFMSLAMALFGIMAGFIANQGEDYFDAVMITIGLLIMSSSIWAYLITKVKSRK